MAVKIMLDAGHAGFYNQSPVYSSYYESKMTWKLQTYLKTELKKYGFTVGTTRTDQTSDPEVYKRGTLGKGYNLLLSLHSNATATRQDETDYPVAYAPFDKKADALGLELAKAVERTMQTRQKGRVSHRTYENGGVTYNYYGVIRGAASVGVPAIILEHSFHTNPTAAKWLSADANLKKLAEAEAAVLAAHYGQTKKEENKADPAKPEKKDTFYRVQAGAYSKKANAQKALADLKKRGVSAIIVQEGKLFKLQAGAFTKKENADAMVEKLKKVGVEAFIR